MATFKNESNGGLTIDGNQVIKVWESFQGWYWFATQHDGEYTGVGMNGEDVQVDAYYGYVQGSAEEWGTWDANELKRAGVWTVPKSNWHWTGRRDTYESKAVESTNYSDIGGEKRKVTFVDNNGQQKTGRAVMKGPAGWVVNANNEARPHIVDEGNFVSVESYAVELEGVFINLFAINENEWTLGIKNNMYTLDDRQARNLIDTYNLNDRANAGMYRGRVPNHAVNQWYSGESIAKEYNVWGNSPKQFFDYADYQELSEHFEMANFDGGNVGTAPKADLWEDLSSDEQRRVSKVYKYLSWDGEEETKNNWLGESVAVENLEDIEVSGADWSISNDGTKIVCNNCGHEIFVGSYPRSYTQSAEREADKHAMGHQPLDSLFNISGMSGTSDGSCKSCGQVPDNGDYKGHLRDVHGVNYVGESGLYGYGSATGRMSPAESWNQMYLGGDVYTGARQIPEADWQAIQPFKGLGWSELPTEIQELWKSMGEYIPSGESKANEFGIIDEMGNWAHVFVGGKLHLQCATCHKDFGVIPEDKTGWNGYEQQEKHNDEVHGGGFYGESKANEMKSYKDAWDNLDTFGREGILMNGEGGNHDYGTDETLKYVNYSYDQLPQHITHLVNEYMDYKGHLVEWSDLTDQQKKMFGESKAKEVYTVLDDIGDFGDHDDLESAKQQADSIGGYVVKDFNNDPTIDVDGAVYVSPNYKRMTEDEIANYGPESKATENEKDEARLWWDSKSKSERQDINIQQGGMLGGGDPFDHLADGSQAEVTRLFNEQVLGKQGISYDWQDTVDMTRKSGLFDNDYYTESKATEGEHDPDWKDGYWTNNPNQEAEIGNLADLPKESTHDEDFIKQLQNSAGKSDGPTFDESMSYSFDDEEKVKEWSEKNYWQKWEDMDDEEKASMWNKYKDRYTGNWQLSGEATESMAELYSQIGDKTCPDCGEEFDSLTDASDHYKEAHESLANEASIYGPFVDKYFEEEYVMDQDGMYLCKICKGRMDVHNIGSFSPDEVARHHMKTDHGITESFAGESLVDQMFQKWLTDSQISPEHGTLEIEDWFDFARGSGFTPEEMERAWHGVDYRSFNESKATEMRKLNAKQKSLISDWVNQNKDRLSIFVSAEDLPYELYAQLEEINDFETLNQEIQRFASDIVNESRGG